MKMDKQYKKVMKALENDFGWEDVNNLGASYKDLVNDVIKATRQVNKITFNTPVMRSSKTCPYDERACRIYAFCGTKKCLSKKDKSF